MDFHTLRLPGPSIRKIAALRRQPQRCTSCVAECAAADRQAQTAQGLQTRALRGYDLGVARRYVRAEYYGLVSTRRIIVDRALGA